jgi:hypothetical protein
MPLLTSRIAVGAAASPWKPANWAAVFSAVALPLFSFTASWPAITLYDVTSVWLPVASGTAASRKAFALAITLSPRALL